MLYYASSAAKYDVNIKHNDLGSKCMFKKLLITSAVLAVSSTIAYAGNYKGERDYKGEMSAAPCPTYQFAAGPYLGLSVGPRNNYSGGPTVYKGIEGTLSGGYAGMINPSFYLAGEIFVADSAQLKDFKSAVVAGAGSKTSWSWGASLIPGYMLTDYVLGYVRVGGISSRFPDMSTRASAWQLGLGGQTNVYQNWDIRTEYVYSGYRSINNLGKPAADQFNFGVVYKFV